MRVGTEKVEGEYGAEPNYTTIVIRDASREQKVKVEYKIGKPLFEKRCFHLWALGEA